MLKLISSVAVASTSANASTRNACFDPPRWVPMVRGEENVLVANGWSFLDPDESEPVSAFDIDDANAEAEYRPKWGTTQTINSNDNDNHDQARTLQLSSLGYDTSPLNDKDILFEADSLLSTDNPYSRGVLLHGQTDPPNTKTTCNGFDFRGSAGQSDIPEGIFFAAIGGLPLFSSTDLSPKTASSGWLSFSRPLATSHVLRINPDESEDEQDSDSFRTGTDRRVEVVCGRTRCHLGHYFGPTEGYCINASALRFVPGNTGTVGSTPPTPPSSSSSSSHSLPTASRPISWRPLDDHDLLSPSHRLLKTVLEKHGNSCFQEVALGCGCFWHVEHALRRLPGVRSTTACYAGGDDNPSSHSRSPPTYEEVSAGGTGHAEVVSVVYDPGVCPSNVLFDCFLAMHDPTKVRAHGKHALKTGQYRSCIFVTTLELERIAKLCSEQCRQQLGKELSTEIRLMEQHQQHQRQRQQQQQHFNGVETGTGEFGEGWCWRAEDRHQRHDDRIKGKWNGGGSNNNSSSNLSSTTTSITTATEWLSEYGRRTPSIIGGFVSLERSLHPDDDGMASMMI
mmetsp:Transcript_16381/g.34097  ORF Transcript_16381/g.34097 Transcript_16381/m.34097 type:complete len:566 (+) Transcript_16381:548-2245(+)